MLHKVQNEHSCKLTDGGSSDRGKRSFFWRQSEVELCAAELEVTTQP